MKFISAIFVLVASAFVISAQSASNELWPSPDGKRRDDDSRILKEMLAKQQSARDKKEYEDLIERGEAALKLASEIEESYETKEQLSEVELKKLEEFEKIMSKVRKDLGGEEDGRSVSDETTSAPKDVRDGFLALKRSTEQLVSEIKRSTRFSVSVLAIESSNALVRLARFLRLKN